jgi:hypothetical protein
LKRRKGKRLIVETFSDRGGRGPVAAGTFPNAYWAWLFKHFENRCPPRIAVDRTRWRAFSSWNDAVHWLEST